MKMLIRIENHSATITHGKSAFLTLLATALCDAAATARVPGIDTKSKITVVAGGAQIFEDDQTLIVIVECLFDRPDRPKEVRDRLAKCLAEAALEKLPKGWRVEVFVKRFNTEKDSYAEAGGDDAP